MCCGAGNKGFSPGGCSLELRSSSGNSDSDGDSFCDVCGTKLRWDDSCPRCHPDPPRAHDWMDCPTCSEAFMAQMNAQLEIECVGCETVADGERQKK
jgi:hypothetical protein